jgi:hypothetical protein
MTIFEPLSAFFIDSRTQPPKKCCKTSLKIKKIKSGSRRQCVPKVQGKVISTIPLSSAVPPSYGCWFLGLLLLNPHRLSFPFGANHSFNPHQGDVLGNLTIAIAKTA